MDTLEKRGRLAVDALSELENRHSIEIEIGFLGDGTRVLEIYSPRQAHEATYIVPFAQGTEYGFWKQDGSAHRLTDKEVEKLHDQDDNLYGAIECLGLLLAKAQCD